MATNIIEAVKEKIGMPVIQKVDPNSQEPKKEGGVGEADPLSQAALSGILAAFYRLSRTESGCRSIVSGGPAAGWLGRLFGENKNQAVENVAQFAGVSPAIAEGEMDQIAQVAADTIRTNAGEPSTVQKVKSYLSGERHHILVYLPASLKWGDLLNDEGLDDKTNKMEGPISNLMHKIENKLSGGDS